MGVPDMRPAMTPRLMLLPEWPGQHHPVADNFICHLPCSQETSLDDQLYARAARGLGDYAVVRVTPRQ